MVFNNLFITKYINYHNSCSNLNVYKKNSVLDSQGHFPDAKHDERPLSYKLYYNAG